MTTDRSPDEKLKMTVSERSADALAAGLATWLASALEIVEPPVVTRARMPEFGGLSSTSVLFDADWTAQGTRQHASLVARMAPEPSAVPVFPSYDLPGQYELIEQVTARCGVPLPRLRWNAPDGGPLGTAFFIMDQVAGQIPLDNPPYVFTGWLLDAEPRDRARLQHATVKLLAELHSIPDPHRALRFESSALIVIIGEDPDGTRTLNNAKRVFPDGRVEQLGWPRAQISYQPGTRHPRAAVIALADRSGERVSVEIETGLALPLHVGAGYSGDPDWSHGRWMGHEWSGSAGYDLTDPAVAGRIPFGVIDHVARATMNGEAGWGMLEHASMGRHDPSGFADWSSVAP